MEKKVPYHYMIRVSSLSRIKAMKSTRLNSSAEKIDEGLDRAVMTMRKGEEAVVKIKSAAASMHYQIKLIDFIKVQIPTPKIKIFNFHFFSPISIKMEPNLALGEALLENGCSRKNSNVQIKEARRKHTLPKWEISTGLK